MRPNSNVNVVGKGWYQVTNSKPPQSFAPVNFGNGNSYADVFASVSHNTPGFKKLKRRELPYWPHSFYEAHRTHADCTAVQTDTITNGNTQIINYWGPSSAIFGLDASSSSAFYPGDDPSFKALTKLYSDISLTKGSAAVTAAEIGKTAQMLASTATRLISAYRSLRKGDLGGCGDALNISFSRRRKQAYRSIYLDRDNYFKNPRRRVRRTRHGVVNEVHSDWQQFAASTWLEVTYGWKPLLSDIYTQAENLSTYLVEKQGVVREARSSASAEKTYMTKDLDSPKGRWVSTKEVIVRNRVTYTARFTIPGGTVSMVDAFGLQNPAVVLWEIIPFSFVADWFIPIGKFLEAVTATSGLAFHSGTKTMHRETKTTCRFNYTGKPNVVSANQVVTYSGSGTANGSERSKDRVLMFQFPSVPLPSFKDPRSISHATSAIALIQSVFHGSVKYR